MAGYNVDYELASMAIEIIMILLYYQRRNYPSASIILYKRIMVFALCSSATNIMTIKLDSYGSIIPLWINYPVNIIYFIMQNMLTVVFVLFTATFLEVKAKTEKMLRRFAIGISIFIVLAFATSPFTHWAFWFDESGYHRGPLITVFYILSFIELFMAGVIAVKQGKEISSPKKVFSILSFVCLLVVAVLVQYLIPPLCISGFAIACSCLIMYMMLQNPDDVLDEKTGLFKRDAFLAAITECYRSDHGFTVLSVVPNNADNVVSVMGRDAMVKFIAQIGSFLKAQYDTPVYTTDETSVTVILDDPIDISKIEYTIKKRFEQPWYISGVKLVRSCDIAYTGFPSPIDSIEDLIPAVDYMISKVKNDDVASPFFAQNVPKITDRLGELEAEKELLEAESMEAILARERAEKENKMKNVFLANMSHEIRTPMNAILGMTDLVLRDDISQRVRDMMEDIESAGNSLMALIDNLLDITKIESDHFELQNRAYSLKKLISDAVISSASRIQNSGLELFTEIAHDVPDKLFGDENRLKQVFVNLMNNAIKYTNHGYVKLKVYGERNGDIYNLRVDVSDTGSGIREQDMKKLFNTFSRALNEENINVEGTGLGLAICKKIVTLMGGDIDVESKFGEGSRFFFYLPQKMNGQTTIINSSLGAEKEVLVCASDRYERRVQKIKDVLYDLEIPYYIENSLEEVSRKLNSGKITDVFTTKEFYNRDSSIFIDSKVHVIMIFDREEKYNDVPNAGILYEPIYAINVQKLITDYRTEAAVNESFVAPKDAKVMVVDDYDVNLKVIRSMLSKFGIDADCVSSGPEAIEKAGTTKYDLIFMDHMMPDMDGIEATKRIRGLSPIHSKMPIVMLSANAVNGAEEMFKENNFDEFVSKPVNMARLEQVLRKFL